jgi:hypothetical protein
MASPRLRLRQPSVPQAGNPPPVLAIRRGTVVIVEAELAQWKVRAQGTVAEVLLAD